MLCEIEGALKQIKLSTDDEGLQFEALSAVLDYLSSLQSWNITPVELGTERNRIVREITSTEDPYAEIRRNMNRTAIELEPIARRLIENEEDGMKKLRQAIKISVLGNSFDFSVSEHELDLSTFREKFKESFEKDIDLDDSEEIALRIASSDSVLYVLDNSGEAVLDGLLMERILEYKPDLTIAARSGAVQDDLTLEMAKNLNLDRLGDLLPAGRTPGVDPVEASRRLKDRMDTVDLIVSKGQGNFEMLSEHEESFEGRLAYLLMAKCEPVSEALGVPRGSTVCKAI